MKKNKKKEKKRKEKIVGANIFQKFQKKDIFWVIKRDCQNYP